MGQDLRFYVVSSADNIENLDTGRADGPFWEGIKDGSVSEAAGLAAVSTRPAMGWITATPHGGEAAAAEAISKMLYELTARVDCWNLRRLARDGPVPHAGPQPGRARRASRRCPHVRVGVRPQP